MAEFRTLATGVLVSGQIDAEDIASAASMGVTHVVNNRPDGEEPGQPTASEIEATARKAGLAYHHIPVRGLPDDDAVEAVRAVLNQASGGAVLLHCKSGMRSTAAWAMATAATNGADRVRAAAAAAGYDLSRLPL